MTNHADVLTYTDNEAADALVATMNALVEATADALLMERLRAAPARIIELIAQQDALIVHQRTLADAKAKAAEDARFARFSSIHVADATPEEHVLRSSFEITWTATVWDSNAHASLPQTQTIRGFGALPDGLLSYLIERHPEKIPAKITALAATPYDAFERYFVSLSRGYIRGNSYDAQRAAGA